jgi:hypothetical protein
MKMKYLFPLIYLSLFITLPISSQNLVGNSGFETYSSLPTSYGQYSRAVGWTNCSGSGSSDYYHTSGSVGTAFGPMAPYAGNGQMGFLTRHSSAGVAMEYVCRSLNTAMTPGLNYEISFYVTRGDGSGLYASSTGNIGALLTVGPAVQSGGAHINQLPQVEETAIINVTNAWQQLYFTYTPAIAYNHISIGNFHDFASTPFVGGSGRAYYYVDEVVVQPVVILSLGELDFELEKYQEDASLLTWSFEQPDNIISFNIQRSANGVEFENIAENLSPEDDQFMDEWPYEGENYYRLRIEFVDGTIAYSEVKTLSFEKAGKLILTRIYPNPFQNYLVVDLQNNGDAEAIEIRLTNMLGQLLHREHHQLQEGRYKIELSSMTTQLPAGTYNLEVISENGWRQLDKVIKY